MTACRAGAVFVLNIWPPISLEVPERGTTPESLLPAVTRINQAIEALVLAQPGQYLWAYARYKTPRQSAVAEPLPAGKNHVREAA